MVTFDQADPPSGTVTFLFTDVVGSTQRWERDPTEMAKVMARHDELAAGVVSGRRGYLVKLMGDGMMAAFSTAADAVRAAVDLQSAVDSQEWPVTGGFLLRAGVHTGVADERDDDYFGPTVNRAARLMSAGHGGQVLLSGVTAGLVGSDCGPLLDLGEHRLKDLTLREHVWQVHFPGSSSEFPALRTLDSMRGNLPTPVAGFVGRDQDLEELGALLERARLVTLVGVGGAGKTRLALELAAQASDRFDGGVWVVDLWQTEDPDRIEDALIGTLGLQHDADRSSRQVLADALGFSSVLVVLDTCEHLIDSVSELAEFLVARCPTLTLLCTSREVLSSPSSVARSVDTLGDAAVELFALRAANTRSGFELTEENRPTVEEICGQLDGVPLAIELVAARAATLDPAELLARLRDVFRVVRGSSTGRAQRHQTLEATIEWSYRTLDLAERTLFDRLSVFLGAFTLHAAEEVCAGDDVDPLDIVDVLERLVDKSLVTTVDERPLGRRFRLLDTTRAYAALQLDADGDTAQARHAHAGYFAASLVEAEARMWGTDAAQVRGRVLADLPNFRRAAEWALETQDLEIAVALARLGRILSHAGRFDGLDWLGDLAELSGFDNHPDALKALTALVGQQLFSGDLDRALTLVERGHGIGEDATLACMAGPILMAQAQRTEPPDQELRDRAWTQARRAVEMAEDDMTRLIVYPPLLWFLSKADVEEFYEQWEQYETLLAGQPTKILQVWGALGAGPLVNLDPARARSIIEPALEPSIELGLGFVTSRLRSHLAAIESRSGNAGAAARRLIEVIEEDAAAGAWHTGWSWAHRLVTVFAAAGQTEDAVTLHHAIPSGTVVFEGDDPSEILARAQDEIGEERCANLLQEGARLNRTNLLQWLRNVSANLE